MLGEFEYHVLSATARLEPDAYGAAIGQEIERATARRCAVGALYTTIDRLEKKGFIVTWMGEATAERGGRRKRQVRLTAHGRKAAAAFYNAVVRASEGVTWQAKPRRVRA